MNKEQYVGVCQRVAGKVHELWGEFTDDPKLVNAGRHEQIMGKTQQHSGIAKEQAEQQLKEFMQRNRNWYF